MVTAKDTELDKVLGLEMGADDYVTKPFSNRELIARVKANLRRQATVVASAQSEEKEKSSDIVIGNLTIHPEAYVVSKNDENIELTHREFELLYYLAKHIGQVMTREHLLQTVWGYDYFGDVRTVDVTVRRLREKIEDNPSRPVWLVTRRGSAIIYVIQRPSKMNKKLHFFSRSILRSHWFCFTVVFSLPDRWCGICATLKKWEFKTI